MFVTHATSTKEKKTTEGSMEHGEHAMVHVELRILEPFAC